MALYLGSNKQKIVLDGTSCNLNLYTNTIITNGGLLLSFDNYLLKDSNGVYLTVKEAK